jgi:3-phenylpropionate/trans-cinnamate dioxygenase ferredoxin reductase subunit
VTLSTGQRVTYDHLLLATGASPKRLDLPRSDLPGIFYLRTLEDARSIAAELRPGIRVALIGGGFIGLEVAASAREIGAQTTLLCSGSRLLSRSVTPAIAEAVLNLHLAKGVDVRLGAKVSAFEGASRLCAIQLECGERLPADLAVVGIGAEPNSALAAAAGLTISDGGVETDACGRTEDPRIFAIGDVARQLHPLLGCRTRLECWDAAQRQAEAAAAAICGAPRPRPEAPWLWSDQFEKRLQVVGAPGLWRRTVVRAGLVPGELIEFAVEDSRIVGAIALGCTRELAIARRMIARVEPVRIQDLADVGRPLRTLLPR